LEEGSKAEAAESNILMNKTKMVGREGTRFVHESEEAVQK
jgi:hypothetical protein